MGETENTSIMAAINRVASFPVDISRMIARGTTIRAAPPSPCTKRPADSIAPDGAIMHSRVPRQKIAIPA